MNTQQETAARSVPQQTKAAAEQIIINDRDATRCPHLMKTYKVRAGSGLWLRISPRSKRWIFRYEVKTADGRKERQVALGKFPTMKLADARLAAELARETVKAGGDPVAVKRVERATVARRHARTFEAVRDDWLAERRKRLSPSWADSVERSMRKHLGEFDALPVSEIRPLMLKASLSALYERAPRMARDLLLYVRKIFETAVADELIDRNPAAALSLAKPEATHFSAVTDPALIGPLLRAIERQCPSDDGRDFFALLAYLFTRPGELAAAEWCEIDLDVAVWTIPAARMKKRRDHVVLLPHQAVAILRRRKLKTGGSAYVFPQKSKPRAGRPADRPICRHHPNQMMADMELPAPHVPHGFRATASTNLRKAGFLREWVEVASSRKVAETEGEKAYLREDFTAGPRRVMLQAYADFLDLLKGVQDGNAEAVDAAVAQLKDRRRALLAA